MACVYFFNGKFFENELALDKFLMESYPLKPLLGDLVFSLTKEQEVPTAKLNEIASNAREAKEEYIKAKREGNVKVIDGEEVHKKPPFIGVNRFLSTLKVNGKPLFPEFIEDNYWENMKHEYATNGIPEDVAEVMGLKKGDIVTDTVVFEQIRQRMTLRWKQQAKCGDAAHSVLQIFFEDNKIGEYIFTKYNTAEKLVPIIKAKMAKDPRQLLQYMEDPDETIKDLCVYAFNLVKHLKSVIGEDLRFYPEFAITATTNQSIDADSTKLYGIIDLLVMDSKGNYHILDYKTSIHAYAEFASAKELTYDYQTQTYKRLFETNGVNMDESRVWIAPIQITNFKQTSQDVYSFKGIKYDGVAPLKDTSLNIKRVDKIKSNISEFLTDNAPRTIIGIKDLEETVTKIMEKLFPKYSSNHNITEKQVINIIKRRYPDGKIVPNEQGQYIFRTAKDESDIIANSEEELVKKVLQYKTAQGPKRIQRTQAIIQTLNEGIQKNTADVEFPKSFKYNADGSPTWTQDLLKKYCNRYHKIIRNDVLESYGIIAIENTLTNQVDLIRISPEQLYEYYREDSLEKGDPIRRRKGLTGTYEEDIVQQSRSQSLVKIQGKDTVVNTSLMADAVNGNIELMEMMLILNQTTGFENKVIGNMVVMNIEEQNSIQMSNEQAYYCFKELISCAKKKGDIDQNYENKFKENKLRLASKFELTAQMFKLIMTMGQETRWSDDFRGLHDLFDVVTSMDELVDKSESEKLEALFAIKNYLERFNVHSELQSKVYLNTFEQSKPYIALYNAVLFAIAQLKGTNFKQQLQAHDKWLDSWSIFTKGASGLNVDNPGNLNSESLNLITKLVTESYQNVRDEMSNKVVKLRSLVEKLKKSKGFGTLASMTVGNQANLYKNMIKETEDGDLVFVDPDTLYNPVEKEFLEYALEIINENRISNPAERERLKRTGAFEYYRVPLTQGDNQTVASVDGLMGMLKNKLSSWSPKEVFARAQRKLEGMPDEEIRSGEDSALVFAMANGFAKGEADTETRKGIINSYFGGLNQIERNLESIILKQTFAYSTKKNLDEVFPLIKASMIHLTLQGASQNRVFKDDIQYINDYVKNKIQNQSLINDKNGKKVMGYINKVKQAASIMTLAFAPVQLLYQPLQGLWNDISLMIRNPDGTGSFKFPHFVTALKLVYGDMLRDPNKPSVISLLNEQMGVNDMDMNTYADRLSSNKNSLFWNFTNWCFKFSSRPDYYNRMSLIVSKMVADGSFKAYSIVNGKLNYDWTKDERFNVFSKGRDGLNKNPAEYKKQQSLYYTMAKQFELEGTTDKNGDKFKVDMSNPELPRAYTTKEIESMKALGDEIYGYYSHEKKSLMMSMMVSGMWLQFKTYWSSKKNQYLGTKGVKLQGHFEHYKENNEYYYYQVNQNGEPLYDEAPTTKNTGYPLIQWKGQWQEGVLLTMTDLLIGEDHTGSSLLHLKKNWNDKWNNENEDLRIVYRSNLKKILFDLLAFFFGGLLLSGVLSEWLKDFLKENKNANDLLSATQVGAAEIAVQAVQSSFMDFNFFESGLGAVGQWTPFSIEWTKNTVQRISRCVTGNMDIYDFVVKSFGATKQINHALDMVKPEYLNYTDDE